MLSILQVEIKSGYGPNTRRGPDANFPATATANTKSQMASEDAAAALYLPRKSLLLGVVVANVLVTDSTLTVRVIKNFPYRTTRNLVLHHLDLTTLTVGELKEIAKKGMGFLSAFGLWLSLCRGAG